MVSLTPDWKGLFGANCRRSFSASCGMDRDHVQKLFSLICSRADRFPLAQFIIKKPIILLMTLFFLKTYPTVHSMEQTFHLSHDTCAKYVDIGLDVLLHLLDPIDLNYRFNQTPVHGPAGIFEGVLLAVDGTVCEVERPGDNNLQHLYYNAHWKIHAVDYIVAVRIRDGFFCFISGPYLGSMNDLSCLYYSGLLHQLLVGEKIIADSGFVGLDPSQAVVPYKPSPHHPLSIPQITVNMVINSPREIVDNALHKLKIFDVLVDRFRGDISSHQRLFVVCCQIANFLMPDSPVRARPDAPLLLN
jgi:hypothetical protein